MNKFAITILALLLFTLSCMNKIVSTHFPYSLSKEGSSIPLPQILDEISGLAYAAKDQLLCVQDEKGIIFLYDIQQQKIVSKSEFVKEGDFEGIAYTGKKIYALKSNGTLYKIDTDLNQHKVKAKKITTFLNDKYDTEGLCYDAKHNRLLIVCKGKGKKVKKGFKAIFAYDLKKKKLLKEPVFEIIIAEVMGHKSYEKDQKLQKKSIPNLKGNLSPSGIAIHPITNETYVLSSRGKLLVVLSPSGKVKQAIHLNPSSFKQPEGIAFAPDGTMYISNEAKGGKANIQVFPYQP